MSAAPIPVVILGDTSRAIHHGCRQVIANLLRGVTEAGGQVIARHAGPGWRTDPLAVPAIRHARAVIINGEGTIHHDRPGGHAFLAAAEFARDHGVPAFLINCTWEANSAELTRRAAVFRRIYVRESHSQRELAAAGITSTVVPDLTLATPPPASGPRSGWWITDSAQAKTTAVLYRLARALPETRFAPIIAGDWTGLPASRLRKRQLQRWLGRTFGAIAPARYVALAHTLPDATAYVRGLAATAAVLTGRFHAACFALVTGTPMIAVRANTSKIEALLHDAGLRADRLVPLSELTATTIRDRLARAAFDATETANVAAYVTRARTAIATMFADIVREAA